MNTRDLTTTSDLGHDLEIRTQEAIADIKDGEERFLAADRQARGVEPDGDDGGKRRLVEEEEHQARAELQAAIESAEALLDEIDDLLGHASARADQSSAEVSRTSGLVSKAHDVIFQGSSAEEGFLEGLACLLDQALSAARQLLGLPPQPRGGKPSLASRMSRMAKALLGLQQPGPTGLQSRFSAPTPAFGQNAARLPSQLPGTRAAAGRLTPRAVPSRESNGPEPHPGKERQHPGCPLCSSKEPAHQPVNSKAAPDRQTAPTRGAGSRSPAQARPAKPKEQPTEGPTGSPSRSSHKETGQKGPPSSGKPKRRDQAKTKKPKVPPAFALPFPVMAPMAPSPALPLPPPRPIPAVPPGIPAPGPAAPFIAGPPAFSLKG